MTANTSPEPASHRDVAGSAALAELRDQLRRRHVIVFVGAGVSAAATGGDPLASWAGLLRHGAQRCAEVAHLDRDSVDIINNMAAKNDSEFMVERHNRFTSALPMLTLPNMPAG